MDLLTADEEEVGRRSREFRFDIGCSRRLLGAVDCLAALGSGELRVGLFGASSPAGLIRPKIYQDLLEQAPGRQPSRRPLRVKP